MLAFVAPEMSPASLDYIIGFAISIVLLYLVPFLRSQAAIARANATHANLDIFERIKDSAEAFICDAAAKLLEIKLPDLAQRIETGQVKSKADVATEVTSWVGVIKDDVHSHFTASNIDLAKHLGDDAVDKLIQSALNKLPASPAKDAIGDQVKQAVANITNTVGDQLLSPKP